MLKLQNIWVRPLKIQKIDYSGNNLACANCHLKAGAQAGSGSWVGVLERFPQFGGRGNRIGTIEDRINGCMERSMNGKKMAVDADKMEAIVAYMDWLSEDLPEDKKKEYKGYPAIQIPDAAVDMEKGKLVLRRNVSFVTVRTDKE